MGQQLIFGSSEMADRVRAKDWSGTPLGSIDTWSESLRSTVNTMLSVPTPIQLFWGPECTTLYNDALIPFILGKHPDALGAPAQQVWSEAWPSVGGQIDAVFREGRTFRYDNLPLSLVRHGVLEDGYYSFTYSPVFAPDGSVIGLLNVTQNTTEAVVAQKALSASENRFRTLINQASVGIAIGSLTGELTFMNTTLLGILGYSVDEVARGEVRWDTLTPTRFADLDALAIRQLQTTGVAEPYEKAYCTKSGELVPLLIGAVKLPPDAHYGLSNNIAVFATDLRRQKRAENALLQSEKLAAVGKLASSISHEINNPLEAVTNLLYIVRQDPALSQASVDFLQTADRELARVSQITSQTLRFHRQSSGPTTVQPEALVDEVLQLYAARLGNAGIKVRREYEDDTWITCYEGDIRQVLNNLLGNAIDAMKSGGGRLTVRARHSRRPSTGVEGALITVADTGSGMSPEVQRRIFDAFYTTKGIHGTGLGLWISCRIVHKHQGYVRARSSTSPQHRGTAFQLWLPTQLASSAREPWNPNQAEAL